MIQPRSFEPSTLQVLLSLSLFLPITIANMSGERHRCKRTYTRTCPVRVGRIKKKKKKEKNEFVARSTWSVVDTSKIYLNLTNDSRTFAIPSIVRFSLFPNFPSEYAIPKSQLQYVNFNRSVKTIELRCLYASSGQFLLPQPLSLPFPPPASILAVLF